MVTCVICGKEIEQSIFIDSVPVMCSDACHRIHFWNEKVEKYGDGNNDWARNVVIVNGTHYHFSDDNPEAYFKGFGGRQFAIQFHDGRFKQTKNLWCQGDIPEEFRDRLKDNAIFVESLETFAQRLLFKDIINSTKNMKKEEASKKPQVDDNINVDIFQPKEGKFPIGRYNGIICKLQLAEGIKFVPYGSTCHCEVLEVKQKCLIVKVMEVIKSPEANRFEAQKKIDELKQKLDSNKVKKEKKQKRNFPFLSKNEKK